MTLIECECGKEESEEEGWELLEVQIRSEKTWERAGEEGVPTWSSAADKLGDQRHPATTIHLTWSAAWGRREWTER
ncbi:hypothetical protein AVEN_88083-1 [Araneus ventricosus]|uniref:Uncharacterized protein n=1 Tax=Araneus ventricosus TaxID=182803 RepID=A0A4Y2NID6_ARAVE|nr:hypothetical protein AVEN_88083-1 [Araneus ventricosus]